METKPGLSKVKFDKYGIMSGLSNDDNKSHLSECNDDASYQK